MRRIGFLTLAVMLVVGCGGGSSGADNGVVDIPLATDTPMSPDVPDAVADVPISGDTTPDPGRTDPGTLDYPQGDPDVADEGPSDPGQPDPGPVDNGPGDPGPEQGASVVWVSIPGGTFPMGATDLNDGPVHLVTVPAFSMGKTEVTIAQYSRCTACTGSWGGCDYNGYGLPSDTPMPCLSWNDAYDFCAWAGGRLCSEAEWEYAARNGSAGNRYPWGDTDPTCDDSVWSGNGCQASKMASACSKPAGNDTWGVCDLAGNLWEWVQDSYHTDYTSAPTNGGAWIDNLPADPHLDPLQVLRGGSYDNSVAGDLRGSYRGYLQEHSEEALLVGARCCKSECLTGIPCVANADCPSGTTCNTRLTPPACQKLRCGAFNTACSWDEECMSQDCEFGLCTGEGTCHSGQCICTPQDHKGCCGSSVCWIDSCGHGTFLSSCPAGCAAGKCNDCTANCGGKNCGDDGCGGSCGKCGDGQTCNAGQCKACLGSCNAEMVSIPGGTFQMGTADPYCSAVGYPETWDESCGPVHSVTVPAFGMSKTEVTLAQYRACEMAGACTAVPCVQWGEDGPVVCVLRDQAQAYCAWVGGRLCSEAEWEYAARNGSAENLYPWGDTEPTCADGAGVGEGCKTSTPTVGCSTPAGNDTWGVCDLAGSVQEWVADDSHGDYTGAPTDGSAWVFPPGPGVPIGIIRGGFEQEFIMAHYVRAVNRLGLNTTVPLSTVGIRCCRSL